MDKTMPERIYATPYPDNQWRHSVEQAQFIHCSSPTEYTRSDTAAASRTALESARDALLNAPEAMVNPSFQATHNHASWYLEIRREALAQINAVLEQV